MHANLSCMIKNGKRGMFLTFLKYSFCTRSQQDFFRVYNANSSACSGKGRGPAPNHSNLPEKKVSMLRNQLKMKQVLL